MFGFRKKQATDAPVLTLDLHTTSPGEPESAIKRNYIKRKPRYGGANLYNRADKFLMRSRVTESGREFAELY